MLASGAVVGLYGFCMVASFVGANPAVEGSKGRGSLLSIDGITNIVQRNLDSIFGASKEELQAPLSERFNRWGKRGNRYGREYNKEKMYEGTEIELKFQLRDLFMNPIEFTKDIYRQIDPNIQELLESARRGMVYSVETTLRPAIGGLKRVEDFLEPSECTLRAFCRIGSMLGFTKKYMRYLSSDLVEDSRILKAVARGVLGHKCEQIFVCKGDESFWSLGIISRLMESRPKKSLN